jgi:hypothetical protein
MDALAPVRMHVSLAACQRGVREWSAGARGSDSTSKAGGSGAGPFAIQAEDALAALALAGTLVVEGSDALRA